jgi:hypothetical protein
LDLQTTRAIILREIFTFLKKKLKRKPRWKRGGTLEILNGTIKANSGPHYPDYDSIDEIELMHPVYFNEARINKDEAQ